MAAAVDEAPGDVFPLIAFGTYKVGRSKDPEATDAAEVDATIKAAVEGGYRAFDCAQFYQNEKEVGDALWRHFPREKRNELWIVGKVWPSTIYAGPEAVVGQLETSLRDLQLEYFDLFLIHWPVPEKKHVAAYQALQPHTDINSGKIRRLGLSNYTVADYEELMEDAKTTVKPFSNQFEVNPVLYRRKTIEYFQKTAGLRLQAYRPFADGRLLKVHSSCENANATARTPIERAAVEVGKIADKHGIPPAQVLLLWGMQKGIQVLPKSSNPDRIKANFVGLNVQPGGAGNGREKALSEADVEILDSLHSAEEYEKTFKKNYLKCIVRETPLAGTMEVKAGDLKWFDED